MVHIKHPELHKYRGCRPQIRGPDAELVPPENVTLKFSQDNLSQELEDSVKVEDPDSCGVNFEDHIEGDHNDVL